MVSKFDTSDYMYNGAKITYDTSDDFGSGRVTSFPAVSGGTYTYSGATASWSPTVPEPEPDKWDPLMMFMVSLCISWGVEVDDIPDVMAHFDENFDETAEEKGDAQGILKLTRDMKKSVDEVMYAKYGA
jgi:hypothetical protein